MWILPDPIFLLSLLLGFWCEKVWECPILKANQIKWIVARALYNVNPNKLLCVMSMQAKDRRWRGMLAGAQCCLVAPVLGRKTGTDNRAWTVFLFSNCSKHYNTGEFTHCTDVCCTRCLSKTAPSASPTKVVSFLVLDFWSRVLHCNSAALNLLTAQMFVARDVCQKQRQLLQPHQQYDHPHLSFALHNSP